MRCHPFSQRRLARGHSCRRLLAERNKEALPDFKPPKPTMADGINTLVTVLDTTLKTTNFLDGMRRCFIDVGLLPFKDDGSLRTYISYVEHKRGSMNSALFPTAVNTCAELIEAQDGLRVETRIEAMDEIHDDEDTEDTEGAEINETSSGEESDEEA